MNITPLYKNVDGVLILSICTKADWTECREHKDCIPVAMTIVQQPIIDVPKGLNVTSLKIEE